MNYYIKKEDIKPIYKSTQNSGCLASNRIMIDGLKVGYMYRDEPSRAFPDSGWRFFAGDESDEYANNPNNFGIYDLNTICNYDLTIIPYLEEKIGTAFVKDEGVFVEDHI